MTSRRAKQFYSRGVERVTFVVKAENRSDILAAVVQLFHGLNVEVEALYMVRRRGSETLRIHVTVEANQEACRRIEANLQEILSVNSVKTERSAKEGAGKAPDEES
jgi:acetolactate synthase small subunit